MSPVITFDLAGDSESPILLYKGWPAKSEKVGWVLLGQYWVGMAIRAPDEAKKYTTASCVVRTNMSYDTIAYNLAC